MDQDTSYRRVTAQDSNEYICPLEITLGQTPLGVDQLEDCVEAEVVGRYIGHLRIVDSK